MEQAERLTQLQPDMIIVNAKSEARDALKHVVMATRDVCRSGGRCIGVSSMWQF